MSGYDTVYIDIIIRAGEMDFKVVLSATMVGRQNFLNSKHSRMAKTVTYTHLVDLCNKIRDVMEMYIKPFSCENYCRQSAIK